MILSHDGVLEYADWLPSPSQNNKVKPAHEKLDDVEKQHILDVLQKTNWKVSDEKGGKRDIKSVTTDQEDY